MLVSMARDTEPEHVSKLFSAQHVKHRSVEEEVREQIAHDAVTQSIFCFPEAIGDAAKRCSHSNSEVVSKGFLVLCKTR